MVGLLLGAHGTNHGVEFHQDVVDYARDKLATFKAISPALYKYAFAEPQFVVGNCLCIDSTQPRQYDRVYCGASVAPEYEAYFQALLKVGGILVMPMNDTLVQITRRDANVWP